MDFRNCIPDAPFLLTLPNRRSLSMSANCRFLSHLHLQVKSSPRQALLFLRTNPGAGPN